MYNLFDEMYDVKKQIDGYGEVYYISVNKMKKRYLNNDYAIVGCIGERLTHRIGEYESDDGIKSYYSMQFLKKNRKIIGYICIGDNQWLAVVKKSKLKKVLLFMSIMILIGLLVGFFFLKTNLDLDPFAKDYTPPIDLNVKADPDHIIMPGFGTIKMQAGSKSIYMALWNPDTNPCYFKYTLIDAKSNQELYKTSLIAPGKAVTEVKLKEPIKNGEYEMKLKIDTFSLDDSKVSLNGSVINFNLVAVKK